MKFKDVLVNRKDYNIALITWTYLLNIGISESNFIIRISLAGVREGPFQVVGEVPATDVYFEYPTFFRKWQYYYYKVEIIGEDSILDTRIIELSEHIDPYVKKIRRKYDLYLSKRVKNPVKIYKKKKIGHKCQYCWDSAKDEFVKSQCSVCFGTGYGNDNIFGASDLQVDGWLKRNHMGNLEFFRHDWNFEKYPAINSNIDFGVYPEDEFRIEKNGSPLLSLNILGTENNSIFLDYNSDFINHLEDNNFSIYGLENKETFEILTRLLSEPQTSGSMVYRLYHKGVDFSIIEFNGICFGDPETTNFPATYKDGYIEIQDQAILLQDLNGWTTFYLMSGDTIITRIDTSGMLFHTNTGVDKITISLVDNNLEVNDRLYIDYYYDGIYETIIDGKTYKLSNTKNPKRSLAYFTVTSIVDGVTILNLETLSEYVSTDPDEYILYGVETYKINFMMCGFGKSLLNTSVYRIQDRYAMYRMYKKLQSNTVYQIEHENIKKDSFAGCGVLLIDTVDGITYRGPTWDGEEYLDDGDFYVNPEMTEFDTLDLEEKIYELTYIYKLKDLSFNSYFIPTNFEFVKDKLITNTWIFKHPNLINKEDLIGKKLTVAEKDIYEEFDITSYNKEYGIIECQNTLLDANDLYDNLTGSAIFNIIYPHTGGFYTAIESWINYTNSLSKIESLREDGSGSDVIFNSITYYYPRIEPDDLIFDEKTRLFYNVEQVDTPYFRRAELYQKMSVKEAPGADQDRLYKLLDR
jgi:hypothetical protein